MPGELPEEELSEAVAGMKIWGVEMGKLATEVGFESYEEVILFANAVFNIADEEGNYPEIKVREDAVLIDLWTPDIGITSEDVEVARKIEQKLRSMDWN